MLTEDFEWIIDTVKSGSNVNFYHIYWFWWFLTNDNSWQICYHGNNKAASMKASMKISSDDTNSTYLQNLAISIKFLIDNKPVKKLLFVICCKNLKM